MTLTATLSNLGPMMAALIVLLALFCIGVLIWSALPGRSAKARRDADIERQIASLRRHADHAAATRPRVRANGCHAAPGHLKAAPKAEKPKACGGGQCRHQADCSDVYCPGRLAATLSGTKSA
jgi:hypothetical protein